MDREDKKTFGLQPFAGDHTPPEEQYGLLIDTVKCVGCMACFMACKEVNGLPNRNEKQLDRDTYTIVEKIDGTYVRRLCMHCIKPACESVCPVGALQKTPQGPVIYDAKRCIGCRYCMVACPFSIPTYEWNSVTPRLQKCFMCWHDRVSRGEPTGCAEACAYGATVFGKRKDLIKKARRRIRENPGKYVRKIYGEKEIGGTGTMYISGTPFERIPFLPKFGSDPLPVLTWNVLNRLPDIVVLAGVMMAGVTWIVNRRIELAREKKDVSPGKDENKGGRKDGGA